MWCQFLILFGWEKFSVFDRVGFMSGIVEYWMCAMDAIKAAVEILTAGKGQVIKIEKL
jgi:hypothetical protein